MPSAADQTVVRLKNSPAADVRQQLARMGGSTVGQVAISVQNWTSKAKRAVSTADSVVRSSPWQAAGAVALAGLAAGFLVSYGARVRRTARPEDKSELEGG